MATSNVSNPNLFSALPADLRARLFATARRIRLAPKQSLFIADDIGEGCYRIELGALKVGMLSPSGGERILAILGPGAVVGELSVLSGSPRSATISAISESELSFVSRSDFLSIADEHPQIYKSLTMLLAQRLLNTNAMVAATSFLSLQGQVARAMLDLAAAYGREVGEGRTLIQQKITQSDLAAMAGISRENVSRVLNDWKRRNMVSVLAGYYCLENSKSFEKEVESRTNASD